MLIQDNKDFQKQFWDIIYLHLQIRNEADRGVHLTTYHQPVTMLEFNPVFSESII